MNAFTKVINPIARAAELLRECAADLKLCHTVGDTDDWTGEDEAKAAHDEYLAVAAALDAPVQPNECSAFEAWFCKDGDYDPEWLTKSGANHALYMDADTENMWQAWQARAALTQPTTVQQAEPDMRAVCEALGFDPTNHHNAAKCPYCRPAETAHAAMQPDDTPLETGEGDARG